MQGLVKDTWEEATGDDLHRDLLVDDVAHIHVHFLHQDESQGTMTGVHVMITTLRQDPSPDLLMIGIMGCIISLRVPRAMDEAHLGLVRTALDE